MMILQQCIKEVNKLQNKGQQPGYLVYDITQWKSLAIKELNPIK